MMRAEKVSVSAEPSLGRVPVWRLLPSLNCSVAAVLLPLAVYGLSVGMPLFTDRYLIWAMPAFLALAGLGVVGSARIWRPLGWVTLGAILALNLLSAGVQTVRPIKSDLRAAADYVAAHLQADDRLVYQIPYIRYTFSYYASGRNNPNDPAFLGMDGLYTNNSMTEAEAADRMARGTAGAGAVWLIASEAPMWDQRAADRTLAGRARCAHCPC